MIIDKKKKVTKREIDLTGPEGNAFMLLAIAKDLCHAYGHDWKTVHAQMTDGDYEWLIQTMDYYFGDYLIMYRNG